MHSFKVTDWHFNLSYHFRKLSRTLLYVGGIYGFSVYLKWDTDDFEQLFFVKNILILLFVIVAIHIYFYRPVLSLYVNSTNKTVTIERLFLFRKVQKTVDFDKLKIDMKYADSQKQNPSAIHFLTRSFGEIGHINKAENLFSDADFDSIYEIVSELTVFKNA